MYHVYIHLNGNYIFIPILPENLLNYLGAPMPFIVGISSHLIPQLTNYPLSETVQVDLDKNSIMTTCDTLKSLPNDPTWKLRRELKNLTKKIENSNLEIITTTNENHDETIQQKEIPQSPEMGKSHKIIFFFSQSCKKRILCSCSKWFNNIINGCKRCKIRKNV